MKKPKYIYRIFTYENFIDLIVNNQLTFVSPSLWDDPYENYILNKFSQYKVFSDAVYGQCWSFNRENDFMWRVYAPNKNGIKVKCNLDTLEKHLKNGNNKYSNNLHLRKVDYLKKSELIEQLDEFKENKDIKLKNSLNRPINTLFLKRLAFKPEKEFRIMYWSYERQFQQQSKKKIYKWNIDKNILIDSITIDPRINKELYESWKNTIKKLGFEKNIYRSQLYTLK